MTWTDVGAQMRGVGPMVPNGFVDDVGGEREVGHDSMFAVLATPVEPGW